MPDDRGPRIGWLAGGMGAFSWMPVLSGVLAGQGRWLGAGVGAVFFTLGAASVFLFAPWRWPRTAFWKLYLAPLSVLLGGAGAFLWVWLPADASLHPWQLPGIGAVLPLFLPIFVLGRRTWAQIAGEAGENAPAAHPAQDWPPGDDKETGSEGA